MISDDSSPTLPPRPGGTDLRPWVVALLPAALMLALGLWGLDRGRSIWRDEVVTYQVAHRSLPEIWRMLGGIDAVHGLYYLLLHGVFAFWDGGLPALRLPSLLAMTVAAAALAEIGRRLAGARAGLFAGLVFPLLPAVQQYAQEGRSYALVCAAVVLASLLLVRAWQRPGPAAWAGYATAVLVAALLHEFAVLAVAAHGLTLWWGRAPGAVRRGWATATAAAVLALVPLVLISRQQADQVSWIRTPGWSDIWAPALTAAVGGLCACLPQTPGDGTGVVRLRAIALPLLVLPPTALILVSFLDPLYVDRYVVFSYAGLALLLGPVLDRAWSRLPHRLPYRLTGRFPYRLTYRFSGRFPLRLPFRPVLAAFVLPAVLIAFLPMERGLRAPEGRPNDVAAAARVVRSLAGPGDGVLFIPSARREAALYDPAAFAGLRDLALAETGADSGTINGVEDEPGRIRSALRGVDRVVVVTDPKPRPGPSARDRAKLGALAERFHPCRTVSVHGLAITLYATAGRCADQGITAGQK